MDYKHVVEIKNDFLDFFSRLITPNIYDCLYGASKQSQKYYNNLLEISANNSNIKIPDITDIFIQILSDVPHLNEAEIEKIYKDVKLYSNCTYFDDLVRACFKSYVIFLTFNPASENSKFTNSEYYKDFSIKNFIHKCYIESARYFCENPEIFFRKNKKQEIYDIIRKCIEIGLKNTIPYEEIIKEYFQINQMKEHKLFEKNNIHHIGRAVQDFMAKGQYGSRPHVNNLIIDKSSSNDDKSNQRELESFIDVENQQNNQFIVEKIKSTNNSQNSQNSLNSNNFNNLKGGDFVLNTEASKEDVKNTDEVSTSLLFNRGKKIEAEVNAIRNPENNLPKIIENKSDSESTVNITNNDNNFNNNNPNTITNTNTYSNSYSKNSDYSETSLDSKNTETSVTNKTASTEYLNSPVKVKKNNLDRIDENLETNINVQENSKNNSNMTDGKNNSNMTGGRKNSIKILKSNKKSEKMTKAEEQFKNFAKENKLL